MKAYIYQIKNIVADTYYIGSSSVFPTERWAEHIRLARRGEHTSYRFQELFNSQDGDLTVWEFKIIDFIEDLTGLKELHQREAEWILGIPASSRLNMPNQTTTTRTKQMEVEKRLKEGQRYIDIRDEVGISMGMISRINKELKMED